MSGPPPSPLGTSWCTWLRLEANTSSQSPTLLTPSIPTSSFYSSSFTIMSNFSAMQILSFFSFCFPSWPSPKPLTPIPTTLYSMPVLSNLSHWQLFLPPSSTLHFANNINFPKTLRSPPSLDNKRPRISLNRIENCFHCISGKYIVILLISQLVTVIFCLRILNGLYLS